MIHITSKRTYIYIYPRGEVDICGRYVVVVVFYGDVVTEVKAFT